MSDKKQYVEDAFVGEVHGPVCHRSYDPFFFKLDFAGVPQDYFSASLEVIHEGQPCTLGSLRRKELHKLLDQHINHFSQGVRKNPYVNQD